MSALVFNPVKFRLSILDETTSTNAEIKRALENDQPEGLAVRARLQTEGYGRQGRTWTSPEGGLYLSVLLRPKVNSAQLSTLSLVVSLAVRRALVGLEGCADNNDILIKWPNDLVVPVDTQTDKTVRCSMESSLRQSYRKLCGISLEAHAGGVCVGIGMNVKYAPLAERAADAKNLAFLSDHGYSGSINTVAKAVLDALSPLYTQWATAGFTPLIGEYERYSFLTGRMAGIVNRAGGLIAEGRVKGVDKGGHLLLQLADGTVSALSSGEAHLR